MSYVKEARLTLAGDDRKAVEATGQSFQDFAHAALRGAVENLTKPKKKRDGK